MTYDEPIVGYADLDGIREYRGAEMVDGVTGQILDALATFCTHDARDLLWYCLGRFQRKHVGELTLEQANRIMAEHGGSLDLCNTDIKSLPDGLRVKGNLILTSAAIASLPVNLMVEGCLILFLDKKLKKLFMAA